MVHVVTREGAVLIHIYMHHEELVSFTYLSYLHTWKFQGDDIIITMAIWRKLIVADQYYRWQTRYIATANLQKQHSCFQFRKKQNTFYPS